MSHLLEPMARHHPTRLYSLQSSLYLLAPSQILHSHLLLLLHLQHALLQPLTRDRTGRRHIWVAPSMATGPPMPPRFKGPYAPTNRLQIQHLLLHRHSHSQALRLRKRMQSGGPLLNAIVPRPKHALAPVLRLTTHHLLAVQMSGFVGRISSMSLCYFTTPR